MSAFQHRGPRQEDPFAPPAAVGPLVGPALDTQGPALQLKPEAGKDGSGPAPSPDRVAPLMAHLCEPTPGPAHTAAPDQSVAAPTPSIGEPKLAAAGALDDQVAQARATLAQIENSVRAEDYGTRRGEERNTKGKMDEERTRAALSGRLCDLQKAAGALRTEADKRAFVADVQKLLHDYLATPLYGSDDAEGNITPEVWAAAGDSAGVVLTGSSPDNKTLEAWQAGAGYVKFAVSMDGQVRVGPQKLPHQVIAGRRKVGERWVPNPVLSAGVLHFKLAADGTRSVDGVENTSGGFRPGALRNDTALQALKDAKSLPSDSSTIDVHQNPTGDYDTSSLAETGHGQAGAPIAHVPRR